MKTNNNPVTSNQQPASKKLLNIYFTAGYPTLDSFETIMEGLHEAGVDMIEIGLPYSDPLADGPTIQASSEKALSNGINLDMIFEKLVEARDQISAEIYLMGYYNQWLNYGLELFCQRAQEAGVSGFIVPDLPVDYLDDKHRDLLEKYNQKMCFLITPDTSMDRIKKIDALSDGFVYIVSGKSTTGKTASVFDQNEAYFKKMASYPFKHRTMIGFGIHDHGSYKMACEYANGAIIGSAFIRHIETDFSKPHILEFVNEIKYGK